MYIFNFHHVEEQYKNPDRAHISITPKGFTQFIRFLRSRGMEPVSLKDIVEGGESGQLNDNGFVITFDDAYENFYQYALPVLEAECCPATVFVIAGKIGGTNDWDQSDRPVEARDRLMDREQLQAVAASEYVTIGSHGMVHAQYDQLSHEEIVQEVNQSYDILSRDYPAAFVPIIAYPYGLYTNETLDVMAKTPYRYGMTTQKGVWSDQSPVFEVPRYSVYHRDSNPLVMVAKLLVNRILI